MELPASEIEFWRQYYDIFPFPQDREDARTALLAMTVANMSGRTLNDSHLRTLDDYLPTYLLTGKELEAKFVQKQIERERAMGKRFEEQQRKLGLIE